MGLSPKIFFVVMLLLSFSVAQRKPVEDADESSESSDDFDLYVVCNVLPTVATCILCFFLAYNLTFNTKNIDPCTKPWLCVIVIVFTPAIHALEQYYRVFTYPVSSGLASTLLEGGKELFSSSAALCFMVLVDLQLEQAYEKKDLTILENKEFQLHWPFDLFRPIKFVATEDRLNLMRFFCYLPIPATLTMYGLRPIFEQSRVFSEFYGFLFQVVHFAIASLGDMAVYTFSQGVEANMADLRSSKMSKRIAIFKLSIYLLWLQGLGLSFYMQPKTLLLGQQ